MENGVWVQIYHLLLPSCVTLTYRSTSLILFLVYQVEIYLHPVVSSYAWTLHSKSSSCLKPQRHSPVGTVCSVRHRKNIRTIL